MPEPGLMRALVTGANGFVGRALSRALLARGYQVVAAVRSHAAVEPGCESTRVNDLSASFDWSPMLMGVTHVFHLAAYVHRGGEAPDRAEAANQALNHHATAQLAEQAFAANVRRFIFVSSIKANGEMTRPGEPFTPSSQPQPLDAYGRAKLDGERALMRLAAQHGREYTIVRPPLVYGPGVRANFQALMAAVARGIPLPLGAATENRRNLVYVGNLADCLVHVAESKAAANRLLLPSDGVALSTAELIRVIGKGLGKSARLVPFPTRAIALAGRLLGRDGMTRRLLDSLEIEDRYLREQVGWTPPFSVAQAMRETSQWYAQRGRAGP